MAHGESEENCFTFLWKLENISFSLQRVGEKIESPAFVVDAVEKSKWRLRLYLRAREDGSYISCFLLRDVDSEGWEMIEIKYELAFVSKDGTNLANTKSGTNLFRKGEAIGCPTILRREDVFISKRSEFIPEDTLTARCKIWKVDGNMNDDVQCIACTRIGVEKRSFLWNIINFSTLELEKKYTYEIKSMEDDTVIMSIDLSLTGGLSFEEIIRFKLFPKSRRIKFSMLRLFLVGASGHRVECNRGEFSFNDGSESKTFKFLFSRNKLITMKNSYLPEDTLALHWEWVFSEGVVLEKIENVQQVCIISKAENLDSKKTLSLPFDLNMNLKSLWDENFLCDVQLKTKTRAFNAHVLILSASSSVFKSMFSSDMKEKESNCVDIVDFTDDTISRMLHYIYTTRVEDLTWETASNLYVAADKYAIFGLKNICSSYLKDNLTSFNACELLLFSDLHADGDLKLSVQDYILRRIKDIVNSEEWKLVIETNARLAVETVCLQYK